MRLCVYTHAFYVVYRSELSSRGLRGFATVDYAPDGAVDYGPDDPVDYASGARCGLCGFATVDFPALRTRAHLSAPVVLWSSGLGRGGVGAGFAPTPLRQD